MYTIKTQDQERKTNDILTIIAWMVLWDSGSVSADTPQEMETLITILLHDDISDFLLRLERKEYEDIAPLFHEKFKEVLS